MVSRTNYIKKKKKPEVKQYMVKYPDKFDEFELPVVWKCNQPNSANGFPHKAKSQTNKQTNKQFLF